jgi:hypothetical protein
MTAELRLQCADCKRTIVIPRRASGRPGAYIDPRNEADRRGWKHQGAALCGEHNPHPHATAKVKN